MGREAFGVTGSDVVKISKIEFHFCFDEWFFV